MYTTLQQIISYLNLTFRAEFEHRMFELSMGFLSSNRGFRKGT
jgi:hypothetical protein